MVWTGDRLAMGFDTVADTASIPRITLLMFQSYLPELLWDKDSQELVERWLNHNIPGAMDRKMILLDWCKFYGIPFTSAKAVAIGAEQLPPP